MVKLRGNYDIFSWKQNKRTHLAPLTDVIPDSLRYPARTKKVFSCFIAIFTQTTFHVSAPTVPIPEWSQRGIRSKTSLQTKILHFLGPISTISQRACCWNRSRYTGSSWQHWLKNQSHYLPTIPNHLCHRTKWHYRGAQSTHAITVIIRQSLGFSTNSKPP